MATQDPNPYLLTFDEFLVTMGGFVFLFAVIAWGYKMGRREDGEK